MLDDPVQLESSSILTGSITFTRNPRWRRHMSIQLNFTVQSKQGTKLQVLSRHFPLSLEQALVAYLDFVRKSIWPLIYSITSTFDSTQTDRPTVTLTFLKKRDVKVRVVLFVYLLSNIDPLFQIRGPMVFCKRSFFFTLIIYS